MAKLFEPGTVGAVSVKNRIFMAPLTRNRARPDGVPGDLAPLYYSQRASAGLIVSEATQISPFGKGYLNTPGIYTRDHVQGWRKVTDAVHAKGGRIFLQLWHVGRISHTSLLPGGASPVAPSAVRANTQTFTEQGFVDVSPPRALTKEEIAETIKDYRHAARCARVAGFDGVEVHAANGYLINQFLVDRTNLRKDEYGGSAENRTRFLTEAVEAVVEVWGADRVGVRLSPTGKFNDMGDSDPLETFGAAVDKLNAYGLAYLHMVEQFPGADVSEEDQGIIKELVGWWKGFYIANGDYDYTRARDVLAANKADAVAFGRPFLANPDLPERFRAGAGLNEPDQNTFYGGGAEGYTDYPFLEPALK